MVLELVIFSVLFVFQILFAFFAFFIRWGIEKRYKFPLGEMVEAATTLENYVKIYRSVNLKVHAEIPYPALALDEFVLINKNKIYQFDLFTNFYTLFQLELTDRKNSLLRKIPSIQNFIFLFQFIFLALSFVNTSEIFSYFVYLAIISQFILFGLSLYSFIRFDRILKKSVEIAKDLLSLDDVEIARAEALKSDLKYSGFEYPAYFARNFLLFFIPR